MTTTINFRIGRRRPLTSESEDDGHGSKDGGRRRPFDSSAEEADSNIGRTTGPIRRVRGRWTQQEDQDETLRNAVAAYKGRSWKKIAEFFPDRSEV